MSDSTEKMLRVAPEGGTAYYITIRSDENGGFWIKVENEAGEAGLDGDNEFCISIGSLHEAEDLLY